MKENRRYMRRRAAAALGVLFIAGCAIRVPSAIEVTGADGRHLILNALSQKARDGVLPLHKSASFRYELERITPVEAGTALSVRYAVRGLAPLDGAAGPSIVFEKAANYALPVDFAFFGLEAAPRAVRYTMPVSAPALSLITLNVSGGAPLESAMELLSMSIEPARFGYERETDILTVSPFVRGGKGASGLPVISIALPEALAKQHRWQLKLKGIQGGAFIETRGKRYRFLAADYEENNLTVPAALTGTLPAVVFEGSAAAALLVPAAAPPHPEPIYAEPGFILATPAGAWRDERYEVYAWDRFPSIIIFDTADYAIQDAMFRRLAFFAEKKGYRGILVGDAELEGKHGWNAHDYRAETLAAFFNAAAAVQFPLNIEERELESILISTKILTPNPETKRYDAGGGAVISVSRESNDYLYTRFLVHECFHGLFFGDADFRRFCEERYARFNPQAKAFLRSYFDYLAYDTTDAYLMVNEFMAYLLQQNPGAAGEYFGVYAAGIIEKSDWRKGVLPQKDEEAGSYPLLVEAFERETRAFSDYVSQRWGLAAGRVWRVRAETAGGDE